MATEQKQAMRDAAMASAVASSAALKAANRVARARDAYIAAPSVEARAEIDAAESDLEAANALAATAERVRADAMAGRPVKRGCGYPGCTGVGCASGHD